jgi:hypothetical protein
MFQERREEAANKPLTELTVTYHSLSKRHFRVAVQIKWKLGGSENPWKDAGFCLSELRVVTQPC